MSAFLGEYLSLPQLENEIALTYWPYRYPLQWSQGGKIPEFVANYLASIEAERGSPASSDVKVTVSYLLNELVENSVKFYLSGTIRIRVGMYEDEIVLVVINQIATEQKPNLVHQFSELLKSDPEAIFIARMEAVDGPSERGSSNIGLLSMIMDYQAKLGWNFVQVADNEKRFWMHTMVRVPYPN